jgi:hypothetical protein
MTDELVKDAVRLMQLAIVQHVERDIRAREITDKEAANIARAIIPLIVAHERERCARLMESMAMSRKGQELAIINRKGSKSEARDYQSMAIAHSQGAAAIRAGDA